MSASASEMGSVASGAQTLGTASSVPVTPATGTASPNPPAGTSSNWLSALNPFANVQSFLPNAGLVIIGVVLALGALLVSQKNTVIKVAGTAAKAAAV